MRLRGLIFPFLACAVNGYFGYHLLNGKHGLDARVTLDQQATTLEHELAALREVRTGLERDVALLRPETIDPDMLDERAREILNFAHPDDFVISRPRGESPDR
jgi:cell division protein FtsB